MSSTTGLSRRSPAGTHSFTVWKTSGRGVQPPEETTSQPAVISALLLLRRCRGSVKFSLVMQSVHNSNRRTASELCTFRLHRCFSSRKHMEVSLDGSRLRVVGGLYFWVRWQVLFSAFSCTVNASAESSQKTDWAKPEVTFDSLQSKTKDVLSPTDIYVYVS